MWKHRLAQTPEMTSVVGAIEDWEVDILNPTENGAKDDGSMPQQRAYARSASPSSNHSMFKSISPEQPASAARQGASPVEPWSFSATGRKPIDLGLGSAREPATFVPGADSKLDIPHGGRAPDTGGLIGALDAEDSRLGLGRGGPVKLAVEAAARSSDAPAIGNATFDIAIADEGNMQISLVSASADFDGWNRIVTTIRGNLARKHVRLPSGSRGLRVVVEVQAKEQFPDGTSPSALGGNIGMGPAGPTASYRGKVCNIGVTLAGIGGGCNPENAGSAPRRVVSSRVVEESRF